MSKALYELRSIKTVADHLGNSENFAIINEIKKKNLNLNKDSYSLLNKQIYDKINEQLLNRLQIINQLKSSNFHKSNELNDIKFDIYLTPDTQKVKLFSKLLEIRKRVTALESKIGNWDIVNKNIHKNKNFIL
jgi:hypothetical protein